MNMLTASNQTKPLRSWELLHRGSAEEFVNALCDDALQHPAVNHEYLQRLADGELPDMHAALRDYCHQYYFYSAGFTGYLEAVIAGLSSEKHRHVLSHNLEEECGIGDEANPDNIPHTELFQRFSAAAGVSPSYKDSISACTTVDVWRDLFLQKCRSPQTGVGLGAIGIGTELIVSTVYSYLHKAVSAHSAMSPEDYVFLTLHMDCDDQHADDLKQISIELAEDLSVREALRFGVLSSLNLRNTFWDVMLARALHQGS
jgi:pyrroloquinoline quinone (PQQ) biosynthesis protein C